MITAWNWLLYDDKGVFCTEFYDCSHGAKDGEVLSRREESFEHTGKAFNEGKRDREAGDDSREGLAHARGLPPPFLEQRLQAWGKVVAYRAGALARAKGTKGWIDRAKASVRRGMHQPPMDLHPTPLELAKDWRWTEEARFLWPREISDGGRGGARNKTSAPSIAAGYWDIDAAICGRVVLIVSGTDPYGNPKTRPKMRSIAGRLVMEREQWAPWKVQLALTWLYAVPHYVGEEQTLAALVSAWLPRLSTQEQAKKVDELEVALERWFLQTCGLLGIHVPRNPLCLEDLLPIRVQDFYSALQVCPACYDQVLSTIKPAYRISFEGLGKNVVYDRGLLVLIRTQGGFCVCR